MRKHHGKELPPEMKFHLGILSKHLLDRAAKARPRDSFQEAELDAWENGLPVRS